MHAFSHLTTLVVGVQVAVKHIKDVSHDDETTV